ncbi:MULTISPECIES: Rgg/GadR/MutR family transcriptional regulator [unclassified Streptococcus]|uniref:helix-turn-helix domain-containing protein n=1 Tax=unclassified Streptococcus TaxID=2608887 RepID=UPI0018AA0A32|nr:MULTISPECIES: Rgg/GadR/MutR family transcriptional regulator [unclassified Streptococcus]MBF8970977.1 helix-turn-helix domain-containing protein [Streptococcus sp. NLN76]MBG9368171.1 helix-turn-helix domain-containing protein [Streptococcus sp. NLN64]
MEKIGRLFKKFRTARGLRLKDVAKSGISISQLSRFEKGETDLTITKFIAILDEINMPIDEFVYAAHDFRRDELNEILQQIKIFVSTKNIAGMKKLLISQTEKRDTRILFHSLNCILIKIRLQDLTGETYYTDSDVAYLTNYLFSVDYWGHYELLLFSNTLDVLQHETLMLLCREMYNRTNFYKDLPNNRRLIASMLLNAYITCVERKEYLDAMYLEKQLKNSYFNDTEMYERLIFKYAQNLLIYRKDGDQLAMIEMRKCIGVMRLLDCNVLAQHYEDFLTKLIIENEN